ncbi:SH3 domain-binding protein 2-like [Diadema antillarum]|uniref:SH3 domain-binding protein 2-like n=1 Tax=Diadema antillarum TaxID=105358 RepID=UPI003A87186B
MEPNVPEELHQIGAHDILLRDVMHCGFLYKKAQERRVDVLGEVGEQFGRVLGLQDLSRRWQLRYVIIYQHYVLYFKDDKARRPQGVFSLTGYNRVMRDEAVSDDRKWSFKIIGLRSDSRTWYFNAASEKEMKLWMAYFKVAMEQAIHGKAREKSWKILQDLKNKNTVRETVMEDESTHSGSSTGSGSITQDPQTYEDIEMPLYDDTASPTTLDHPKRPLPSLPSPVDEFVSTAGLRRPSGGASSRPILSRCPPDSMEDASGVRVHLDPIMQQQSEGALSASSSSMSSSSSSTSNSSSSSGSVRSHSARNAPGSPSSRPRFPEPMTLTSECRSDVAPPATTPETHAANDDYLALDFDEDYVTPEPECSSPQMGRPLPPPPVTAPEPLLLLSKGLQQALENRARTRDIPPKSVNKRMMTRQASIDESMDDDKPGLRRGPEGKSFRKNITERPHLPAEVPIKPLVTSKPSDANKPATRPKPKIAAKPPVTKPKPQSAPVPVPLLPDAADIQSSDKAYTESLLRKYRMDGMYLIRLGSEQGQVLMVWDSQNTRCKHYKIFQDQDSNLHLDHNPKFDTVLKLLDFYKSNYLPNSQLLLQKPYTG